MRCSEFLKTYSDYRDGRVHDPLLRKRLTRHVSQCEPCARYDRAITRGVSALRRAGAEPSDRFRVRLRCRLVLDRVKRKRTIARRARVITSLVASAAVVLMVYEGFANTAAEVEAPAALQQRPMPMVIANPGYPFVTFTEFTAPALQSTPAAGVSAVFADSVMPADFRDTGVLAVRADLAR